MNLKKRLQSKQLNMCKIKKINSLSIIVISILLLFSNSLKAETLSKFEILGNDRISTNTIIQFSGVNIDDNVSTDDLNNVIKNLYGTDFFDNVNITFSNGILQIKVIENPIIQSLKISGIKKNSLKDFIFDNLLLKEKKSYVENLLKSDVDRVYNILRSNGYFFATVNIKKKENDNNTIDLVYDINLAEKAFIKKIKFLGDKKFKDRKLKSIIISEENKFWKFISNKKFVDINRIKLDKKLLESFYKNNGYFNVSIDSSSARLVNNEDFELIFKINAGEKFFFNDINLNIPDDFTKDNFQDILVLFNDLRGKPYSLNGIEKIVKEIDKIVLQKEFEFLSASYTEKPNDKNRINVDINLNELEKNYIQRINIYGNYITEEGVIRNALLIDEGDPLNNILLNKSINEIKSLQIFSKVEPKILDGEDPKFKIVNINLEERPTGEIAAGAGTGTSGSTVSFSVKENNYLGKGIKLKSALQLSTDRITGSVTIDNPNYNNSDRTLSTTVQSTKTDNMSRFGYKTSKTGVSVGTSFEQFENIFFSPSISASYEDLETSADASSAKKKQEGTYLDSAFSYGLTLNKLNQNFQPTDGYTSSFYQTLPILSKDHSLENTYKYAKYHSLENDVILSFKFYAKAVNSITGEDSRITKRVFIPSRRLRGFESGKIGPKDNNDFIGGNFGTALNVSSTVPSLLENSENVDLSIFLDAANLWGVDYNSELNDSKIRSSTGVAIDWFTPIGPLSFSLSQPITKSDNDIEEKFRFQIGTTF